VIKIKRGLQTAESRIDSLHNNTNFLKTKKREVKQSKICVVIDPRTFPQQDCRIQMNLVEKFAKAGMFVAVFLTHPSALEDLNKQSVFSEHNIPIFSFQYSGPPVSSLLPAVHSYHVMQWMLENVSHFDVVHFPLIGGSAYYTLLAKHQGWAFQQTLFYIDAYSATLWHKDLHKQWIDQVDDLAADFMEKESVYLADCLMGHVDELFNWMKANEWKLPQKIFHFSKEEGEVNDLNRYEKIRNIQYLSQTFPYSPVKHEDCFPLVSVCLTHFNRPHYLAQALDSLNLQDYPHFEVILIDDASTHPEAIAFLERLNEEFKLKGWTIIRNKKNLFPGAARNLAVSHSKGEYLLFMDDDNYAKLNQISFFVKVAQRVGADILTCAMDVFVSSHAPLQNIYPIHRFLPMGAATGVGLYLNLFGDMNALIKKKAYENLNGLTEERGVGGEDWEFFSRAVLQGYHLETIPVALFWYRDTPNSITKTTHLYANSLRGIRPYLDSAPPALRHHLLLGQAQQEKLQKLLHEHNHLGRLLKRCWQLFSLRAWQAISNPSLLFKKILKK